MAASGASSSGESATDKKHAEQIQSSIYAKLTPEIAKERLNAALQEKRYRGEVPVLLWLLRESRIDGCLTLSAARLTDEGTYHFSDHRFALIRGKEDKLSWTDVNDIAKLIRYRDAKKFVFMNKHTAKKKSGMKYCRILFDSFEKQGFSAAAYLNPSRQEQTRNSAYGRVSHCAYMLEKLDTAVTSDADEVLLQQLIDTVIAEKAKLQQAQEEAVCPITQDVPETGAILPETAHVYDRKAILTWLAQKGTDPMTRKAVDASDVLLTQAPIKTAAALDAVDSSVKAAFAKIA